jgi:hypothetical protein
MYGRCRGCGSYGSEEGHRRVRKRSTVIETTDWSVAGAWTSKDGELEAE